jgi:hypothetical protein
MNMRPSLFAHKDSARAALKRVAPFHWSKVGIGLIVVLFVALRLHGIASAYLWVDDVHTLSYTDLDPTPWHRLLSDSFQHSLDTTGPLLPTLILKTLNNLFGPNVILFRLPGLIAGLIALAVLIRITARLFESWAARIVPALLFTLSVPSILYGQALQPSMFYFLASSLQLYWFVSLDLRPYTPTRVIFRRLQVFAALSTGLFFASYLSVLLYGVLVGCLILLIGITSRTGRFSRMLVTAFNAALLSFPLAILTFLRLRSGDATRSYFEGNYYPEHLGDIPRLIYDFLSYHFNFAYAPDLYRPLGDNLLAVPFVLLCAVGVIYLLWRWPQGVIPLIGAAGAILIAGALKLLPLGGVRHSLALAPFAYVTLGYGIVAVQEAARRWALPPSVPWIVIALPVLLAAGVFLASGTDLYVARRSSLDLDALIREADQHNVKTIVGNCETYLVLGMLDHTRGDVLADHGLALVGDCDGAGASTLPALYLLVDYRRSFDPDPAWPPLMWNPAISRAAFSGATITPLREQVGPLDPRTMGVQSIYYPMNGFFVYLVEPKPDSPQ